MRCGEGDAKMIKKLIFEFLGGLFVSLVCGVSFAFIFSLPGISKVGVNLGGDKASIFFGIFLGLPIGSLLGILFVDKVFYGFQGYNIWGILIGFTLSFFLGGIGSVVLLDKIGSPAIILAPLIIVLFSLVGYLIPIMKG
jgi:hypothetical protein